MSPLPLVGVTTSVSVGREPERAYLNASYVRAVQDAGVVPLLLPPGLDPAARDALWPRLAGLVLTGGGDVDPARFGEPPHLATTDIAPARDALEIDLALRAVTERVPLLAICRGVQVLNVALGGDLYQDIGSQVVGAGVHSQKAIRGERTHGVRVKEGSRLAAVLGTTAVEVNSFHHQAVRRVADGLLAVAWAPDGVIEGLEMTRDAGFVLGVQWHPEDLVGHDAPARALFHALADAARAREAA